VGQENHSSARQHSQDCTDKIGERRQDGEDNGNRTTGATGIGHRTGPFGQDSQDKTAWTGQRGHGSSVRRAVDKIGWVGSGQDSTFGRGTSGAGQLGQNRRDSSDWTCGSTGTLNRTAGT
jgi:hypothetical protein